jgi:hypothetical protein
MLKKIGIIFIALLFAACQSDTETQQSAADQPPMDDPMMQQQEPMADADISDDELETFVQVNISLQETQMEAQEEMIEILDEEGISIDDFNQITQGLQMGQSEEDLDVSDEVLDNYNQASERIEEIEQRLDGDFEDAIAESGIDQDRFMEINMAIQQNPELMQRVQEIMQQEGGMPEQQPQTPPGDAY